MLYGILLIVIGFIFRFWFTFLPISTGDLSFFFHEHIVTYLNPPYMWETFRNLGLGGDSFISQGVYLYNIPLGYLGYYLDYGIIERLIWFYPILILGFLSPLLLAKKLRVFPSKFYPISIIIYLLNTYFFIIMGGGQITVVLGYIAIPLIFLLFLKVINKTTIKNILIFSLFFTLLFAFDFRFFYIFLIIIFVYTVFSSILVTHLSEIFVWMKKYILIFSVSLFILFCLHAYWLLPYGTHFYNPTVTAGKAYTSNDAVTYFSFATFENTLALLHPLWPHNIFGKVGFMKPEFLLLPILAFASLLFLIKKEKSPVDSRQFIFNKPIQQQTNIIISFFLLLGLIGAFLAKGANPPFGEVYQWLFAHVPGFVMFRDPTKWYTMVALSYSILIPFTISQIYTWLVLNNKFQISNLKFKINIKKNLLNIQNIFLLFVTLYLLFLIRPAIFGEFGGTLKPVSVPKEYIDFKDFLLKNNNFSRVLWVPTTQRFTFYSNTHPAISGKDYFASYDKYGVIKILQNKNVEKMLQDAAIAYVVVPDDTQGEIYIDDRKYDDKQYRATVKALDNISWLKKVEKFGNIKVFAVSHPKAHFWSSSTELSIQSTLINPAEYNINIKNAKKGDKIIFVETYDSGWYMQEENTRIWSRPYDNTYNSFLLEKDGNYIARVIYKPQQFVMLGLAISGGSLLGLIILLLFIWKQAS